jgi:hypothetical protein
MATTGEDAMNIQITDDAIMLPVNVLNGQSLTIPLNGMSPRDALRKEVETLRDIKHVISFQYLAANNALRILEGEK